MDTTILKGKWALVTGASSGLGVDFAKQLAAIGCHLILVARREDRLRAVADQITTQYGVQVEIVILDLSLPEAPQTLYDQLKTAGRRVDVLINNAGYGLYGEFTQLDWQREQNMLQLDIMTVTHLTKLFVRDMVVRNFGYVLQVASIGAYQPSPLYATYSAAKSFVLNFSEAVNYELRKTAVKLTVISPGVTKTEFLAVSGQQPTFYQRMAMMQSPDVVRIGLNAMLRGKPSVIPGTINAVTIFLNRLLPRRLIAALAYRTMQSK
ncbi:MAG TPA: SDR family oxidoreductase [Phototrophicaceae bacterium]|jgi:short-subunit dehydrogenase|nr:SDR family oxidoreductase [Phototrophicaceae bacterium]